MKSIYCFTGYRVISARKVPEIQKRLEVEITSLIHQGVRYFKARGALGFDTMAAQTILKLKAIYPHIRLFWYFHVKTDKRMARRRFKIFNQILSEADRVVYTS